MAIRSWLTLANTFSLISFPLPTRNAAIGMSVNVELVRSLDSARQLQVFILEGETECTSLRIR
jgi:hypothetical protein